MAAALQCWRGDRGGGRPGAMTRALLASLLLLAACSTASVTPPGAVAPRGAGAPTGPINLGDWRHGTADAVAAQFSTTVARRYASGLAMSLATADLRTNQFTCTRPPPSKAGDPPDQVCRRTLTENGCTYTWQAHLWDDSAAAAARLTRVRGLYDRRCASDSGLLGGPGAP